MSHALEIPGGDESLLAEMMFPRQIDNRTCGIASLAAVAEREKRRRVSSSAGDVTCAVAGEPIPGHRRDTVGLQMPGDSGGQRNSGEPSHSTDSIDSSDFGDLSARSGLSDINDVRDSRNHADLPQHTSNHYSYQHHPRNHVLHEYSQNSPQYVKHVQKNLHSLASRTGLPWPKAWGTSPWALSALASRVVGVPYACSLWALGGCERIGRAVKANMDSFIFVGRHPMVARHVITVFGKESQADQWMIFEPSVGEVFSVNVHDVFEAPAKNKHCTRPEFGGWNRPILTVTPKVKSREN